MPINTSKENTMFKQKLSWLIAAGLGLAAGLLPPGVSAGQYDGSSKYKAKKKAILDSM